MKRIALILGPEIGYCRQVMLGALDFAADQSNWVFHHARPQAHVAGPLEEWKPDGIIAHVFDAEVGRALLDLKVPLINTTATLPQFEAPMVEADHESVGIMAAEYFMERGFRSFGYFGSAWTGFSIGRQKGFSARLEEAGFSVSVRHAEYLPVLPPGESWAMGEEQTLSWLTELPKPVAILSSNDVPARDLSDLCREAGLKVPEQVALLGVDNDQCVCRMANPALSSIQLPGQKIGFEAARRLEALMAGRHLEEPDLFMPPVRVITRASTDIVATPDEVLSRALSYIRLRYMEPLSVDEVARQAGVSRRVLERKFRTFLDRSILREIQLVRVRRARELLAETKHSMAVVAERSGFTEPRRMTLAFRQIEGCTPTAFRTRIRPGS